MGVEGGHAIEGDIRILRDYYRLGVRYMTLTWSNTNDIGDSSGDITDKNIQHHGGLTDLVARWWTEMNRLGMMVDISHVADSTFYQALELSKAPVIASHSSSRALTNAPRNMTDDMCAHWLPRTASPRQTFIALSYRRSIWIQRNNCRRSTIRITRKCRHSSSSRKLRG